MNDTPWQAPPSYYQLFQALGQLFQALGQLFHALHQLLHALTVAACTQSMVAGTDHKFIGFIDLV
jgi:hypothetical protein